MNRRSFLTTGTAGAFVPLVPSLSESPSDHRASPPTAPAPAIDTLFGADLTLFDGIQVHSQLKDFDPAAQLRGLNYQGKAYTISGERVREMA